jgi:hypothetical protein
MDMWRATAAATMRHRPIGLSLLKWVLVAVVSLKTGAIWCDFLKRICAMNELQFD